MDTKVLEYLIVIAEEKSLSRAAERFYLSQPSLSRHLSKTEAQIGAKLFYRTRNGLMLTDAGKIYINNAQAILHIQNQAMNKLEAMRKERKDKLRLIISPQHKIFFLRRILPYFHEKHPDFTVIVTEGGAKTAEEYMLNDMADMGVFVTHNPKSDLLEYVSLHKDEFVLALPPNSPAVPQIQAHGFSFETMKNDCFILNKEDNEYRQMEQDVLISSRFYPQTLCEVSRLRVALHMVENGYGNAFLPRTLLKAAKKTVPAFSMVPPYEFHLVAAYPRNKVLKSPVKKLLKNMTEKFEDAEAYFEEISNEDSL